MMIPITKSASLVSLPVWGEWIEIPSKHFRSSSSRLSPCGESGLKCTDHAGQLRIDRLSPCGESGLKWKRCSACPGTAASLPVWGEWIEMVLSVRDGGVGESLPVWGEWIEMCPPRPLLMQAESLPVWGEWIEIPSFRGGRPSGARLSPCGESGLKCMPHNKVKVQNVSPRVGRVD